LPADLSAEALAKSEASAEAGRLASLAHGERPERRQESLARKGPSRMRDGPCALWAGIRKGLRVARHDARGKRERDARVFPALSDTELVEGESKGLSFS
jgi:hypothetical protein